MFATIRVAGRGRVGSALAAALERRNHRVVDGAADLVVLCVPDGAIADVARSIEPGPWICHVSGASPLTVCAPHVKRFSVHPLQTFRAGGDPTQFDGAWCAIAAESDEGRRRARWLASELNMTAFELSEDRRALYHAGASIASNYLVTLHALASRIFETAGAPPAGLVPLMTRTIENGFQLTGPIARGDWATVDAHLQALREFVPAIEPVYKCLADATVPRDLT
jgi:predicted short-subunit dehydrogenase-like oxidoreductase (DUF2520 family)